MFLGVSGWLGYWVTHGSAQDSLLLVVGGPYAALGIKSLSSVLSLQPISFKKYLFI